MNQKISGAISIIRPKQWIKNMFVFVPMFFGGSLLNQTDIAASIITFLIFCFAASSIYCLNDIIDAEADRRHPVKCHRPIASGLIGKRDGYVLMAMMMILALSLAVLLPMQSVSFSMSFTHVSQSYSSGKALQVAAIVLFYWALNVAYCLKLKQYAIIDVCVVAFGFVLRILAGGVATEIVLSRWLVLMTFLLTLFLSFAKRRDDVLRMIDTGEPPRKNTIRYNLTFINQAITITATTALVCYIMYTVSPEVVARFDTEYLYLTSILVLLGLLRYIQIAVVDKKSGDPTKVILRDTFTQLVVVAWLVSYLVLIYLL